MCQKMAKNYSIILSIIITLGIYISIQIDTPWFAICILNFFKFLSESRVVIIWAANHVAGFNLYVKFAIYLNLFSTKYCFNWID